MSEENKPSESAVNPEPPPAVEASAPAPAEPAPAAPATESVADSASAASGEKAAEGETATPKKKKKKKKRSKGGRGGVVPQLHKGRVTSVADGVVHVEFGPRVVGTIAVDEFKQAPEVGAEHDFGWLSIEGGAWKLDRSEERNRELWNELEPGKVVQAKVVGDNTGGLDLRIGAIAAFLPGSQIEMGAVKDKASYFGQTLECEVLEVNRKRRRVVVSRKALLAKEQDAKRSEAVKNIAEGQTMKGKVRRLEAFGAIVELGEGLSGLIHVSNISHHRVNRPSDVLSVGQELEVKVLEIKGGGRKIGLGLKQLQQDPWDSVADRFRSNSRHTGKVMRVAEFGAFIELEKGLEGLAHISELSKDRIDRVSDAIREGEEVLVRVISVDKSRKRLSLSRLNQGGELLGSEDDSEEEGDSVGESFRAPPSESERGTNLGDLLRRALEGGS